MTDGTDSLDARLLDAHARDDRTALVSLYAEAAERAEQAEQTDRAAFFLTHAWIFGLETGDPRAVEFHETLVRAGRAD